VKLLVHSRRVIGDLLRFHRPAECRIDLRRADPLLQAARDATAKAEIAAARETLAKYGEPAVPWRLLTVPVGPGETQIIEADPARQCGVVTNTGTLPVIIYAAPGQHESEQARMLPPGSHMDLSGPAGTWCGALYAVVPGFLEHGAVSVQLSP